MKHSSGSYGFMRSPSDPGLGKLWFSFEELSAFTNGFSAQNLLGEGGFGCVYRGCLPDGREVAVKQLKVGGSQGEREFKAEVEIISRVHHRNLVSLIGYCISENHRLLVYDFVPNNTLHYHLHGKTFFQLIDLQKQNYRGKQNHRSFSVKLHFFLIRHSGSQVI